VLPLSTRAMPFLPPIDTINEKVAGVEVSLTASFDISKSCGIFPLSGSIVSSYNRT
jgi:hypothetical protein